MTKTVKGYLSGDKVREMVEKYKDGGAIGLVDLVVEVEVPDEAECHHLPGVYCGKCIDKADQLDEAECKCACHQSTGLPWNEECPSCKHSGGVQPKDRFKPHLSYKPEYSTGDPEATYTPPLILNKPDKPEWDCEYKPGDCGRAQMLKEVGLTLEQYKKCCVSVEEFIKLLGINKPHPSEEGKIETINGHFSKNPSWQNMVEDKLNELIVAVNTMKKGDHD